MGIGTVDEEPKTVNQNVSMQAAVHTSAAAQPSSNQRPGWNRIMREFAWYGRLGLGFCIQASVQSLTERLWKEEVALVRLQTSSCDWITIDEDDGEGDEQCQIGEDGKQAQLTNSSRKDSCGDENEAGNPQTTANVPIESATKTKRSGTLPSGRWNVLDASSPNLLAEVTTSEEEFDLISARNYVWNKAVKPILLVGLSELVYLHCPRAAVAIQILFHPLRVISVRLVCPGWVTESIWNCFDITVKRHGTTSSMAGLTPRLMCLVLGDYYHRLRVEEKIRRFLRRHRINPRYHAMSENLERLCAGLINSIISTTISYPFTVLERRICAERITPTVFAGSQDWFQYLATCVHKEGLRALFAGYFEAILIVIPKYCLRFTTKVNNHVMLHSVGAQWFAVPVTLSAFSSARHARRARMGVLSSFLCAVSDAAAGSYKVLADHGAIPGRQRRSSSRQNPRSSATSLPIVTFRSEESRLSWFRTAYGDPLALGARATARAEAGGGSEVERAARLAWRAVRGPEFAQLQPVSLSIDPNAVLSSSITELDAIPSHLLVSRPLFIAFEGQQGQDWGGLRRVWLSRLAEELFDPRMGLVLPVFSSPGVPTGHVMINPAPDFSCSDHFPALYDSGMAERYYRFMGRVLGIALISGDALGVALTSAFYKTLLAKQPFKVVVMGPPRSGKTTESRILARRCRLRHVSVDKLVRYHLQHQTPQGNQVRSFVQRLSPHLHGAAVEVISSALLSSFPVQAWANSAEDLVYDMVVQYLSQRRIAFRGWVLDGLPATERFTQKLLRKGQLFHPDCVLVLELSDAELRRRFARHVSQVSESSRAERVRTALENRYTRYRDNCDAVLKTFKGARVECHVIDGVDPHRPRNSDELALEVGDSFDEVKGHEGGEAVQAEPNPQPGAEGVADISSPSPEGGQDYENESGDAEVLPSSGDVSYVNREAMAVANRLRWHGGVALDLEDLKQTDPQEAAKLERLQALSGEELDAWLEMGQLGFVTTSKEATVASLLGIPLSSVSKVETEPLGGHSRRDRVSRETVGEYVELVCEQKLLQDVADQMLQVRTGLEELVPNHLLRELATPSSLEARLAGEADVRPEDWRAHSVAKGFRTGNEQVEWFWEHVGECGRAERLRLLGWTTGMVRPPVGGFAQMPHRFTIQCDPDEARDQHLPVAHTCAFQLDLPLYPSKEVLVSKLRTAMEHAHDFQLV